MRKLSFTNASLKIFTRNLPGGLSMPTLSPASSTFPAQTEPHMLPSPNQCDHRGPEWGWNGGRDPLRQSNEPWRKKEITRKVTLDIWGAEEGFIMHGEGMSCLRLRRVQQTSGSSSSRGKTEECCEWVVSCHPQSNTSLSTSHPTAHSARTQQKAEVGLLFWLSLPSVHPHLSLGTYGCGISTRNL